MSKYLLLYLGEQASQDQMEEQAPEEIQEELAKWTEWGTRVGERMVDFGAPTADTEGIGGNYVGGYSIVSAEEPQELSEILADHPHLPYGTIQAVELLDVPGA